METCDVVNDAFSSSASMKSYVTSGLSTSDYDRLDVCLFQDGDINKFFNLTSSLSSIDNVTNSFDFFKDASLNGSIVIIEETQNVNKFVSFQIDAINSGGNDYQNPSYVINDLNLWSDYSVTNSEQKKHCEISMDKFVYNYSFCGNYSTYYNKSLSKNQNFTEKICIDVGDLGLLSDIQARIDNSFENCSAVNGSSVGANVSDIYTTELQQLYQYKNDVVVNFTKVLTDYQNYDTLNNEFQNNLSTLRTKTLNDLKVKINVVLNYVSDNETGLIVGLNCTFLKKESDSMRDSMCVVLVPAFYQLMILILICGGFAYFMSIGLVRNGLMVKKREEMGREADYLDANANGSSPEQVRKIIN